MLVQCLSCVPQVLYSKFGFMYTDIHMDGDDYILIREQDVIAIMPRKSEEGGRKSNE